MYSLETGHICWRIVRPCNIFVAFAVRSGNLECCFRFRLIALTAAFRMKDAYHQLRSGVVHRSFHPSGQASLSNRLADPLLMREKMNAGLVAAVHGTHSILLHSLMQLGSIWFRYGSNRMAESPKRRFVLFCCYLTIPASQKGKHK
ncbi:hypothetical protein SAMN05444126_104140 [Salisediminibacterium halotolerans]|uniref:Uncharacterized protein n=1 Tax=Salisediminibacterium halotolerans TaxID=517425 RepID=A0A1H9RI72_9BACI|nr:hypothetical protein SAMN05444126_104140 [Salisediminibacterium haloalkalitolerans]